MNILMIPSTMLPFPPVKGGAVQNLIKSYVEYNEATGEHHLTIYSIYDKDAAKAAESWNFCHVEFIKLPQWFFALRERNNRLLCRLGFKLIHYFYLRKIKALVRNRRREYDKIVLDNTPQFAVQIAKAFENKVYIHIYNDYLNSDTKDIDEILDSSLEIITVSNYISNRVVSTGLIEHERVHTLYNGVKIDKFGTPESKAKRQELRASLGICEDDFVFIFVARLVPEKGIKELIQAFNLIEDQSAHLVIVGNKLYSGEITDPFLLNLKSMAEKNQHRIHFTGYVDYDVLPDYYAMADVGVLPSLYEEPFALAAIEYMASGLAVILSDAGGFLEMAEGDAAIVVNRGTTFIDDLMKSMKLLLENTELCDQYAQRGYKKSRNYSAENYCVELDSILSK